MSVTYKRRNYFIDRNFQTNFILKFCVIVIFSSALVVAGILFFSRDSNTVAIENTQVTVKSTSDFILPLVVSTLIVVALFSALCVVVLTLLVSHKISGPLYRVQREIEVVARCDFRRNFHIRGGDQLQELARSLDVMCNSLKDSHIELKHKFDNLKRFLEENNYNVSARQAEQLLSHINNLQADLDNFKI